MGNDAGCNCGKRYSISLDLLKARTQIHEQLTGFPWQGLWPLVQRLEQCFTHRSENPRTDETMIARELGRFHGSKGVVVSDA